MFINGYNRFRKKLGQQNCERDIFLIFVCCIVFQFYIHCRSRLGIFHDLVNFCEESISDSEKWLQDRNDTLVGGGIFFVKKYSLLFL